MKHNDDFEKRIKNKLQSSLLAGTPDVWENINKSARQCMQQIADQQDKKQNNIPIKKRWALKGVAAVAAAAIFFTGFSFITYKLPLLQAKAAMIYDTGGCLNHLNYSTPSANFINSYNGFSINILKQLYEGKKNVFISPSSIYLALGMTYNGAQGQTATDFGKALNTTSKNLEGFDEDCRTLQSLMSGNSRFKLANSIWLDSSFRKNINKNFLDRNKNFFGSTISTLDFSSSKAPEVMNRWVKDNTNNRIDPNFKQLDKNAVMNIINTIYFKSNWKQQFDGKNTFNRQFKTPSESKIVKFMLGKFSRYFENTLLQGIILPYDDNKSSMMILLPKTNLNDMLSTLTAENITAYVKGNMNNKTKAVLSLPHVNLSYKASLKDTLKILGLKSAFDPDQANFNGMTKTNPNLFISEVTHMTYLAINEKGTEAAAVTAVQMSGASQPPLKENIMDVDHPFFTAIVNNETGAILFNGIVTDPSVSQ